jgi:hypothetical protein
MRPEHAACTVVIVALCLASLGTTSSLAQTEDLSSERPPGESPTRIEVTSYLIDLMRVIDQD